MSHYDARQVATMSREITIVSEGGLELANCRLLLKIIPSQLWA